MWSFFKKIIFIFIIFLVLFLLFFKKDFIYLFFEKGREGEREKLVCGWVSHTPHWGPGPKPRHVPWLGIELATLWFAGRHSILWATPARAIFIVYAVIVFSGFFSLPHPTPVPILLSVSGLCINVLWLILSPSLSHPPQLSGCCQSVSCINLFIFIAVTGSDIG